MLLSTHVLSEAQQVCDRVLIINKGKIIAEDSPSALGSRLASAERVEVRVKGDATVIAKKIAKIAGVQDIRVHNEGKLEFAFVPGQDIRPQVARAVVESNFDLLEMRSLGMSLEDIFLQLTSEEEAESDA